MQNQLCMTRFQGGILSQNSLLLLPGNQKLMLLTTLLILMDNKADSVLAKCS